MSREAMEVLEASPKYALQPVKPAVPVGYKQTEVGVIPEDWEADRIDQHASIKTGSRNTQDRVEDGAYPFFVRSQQVERINSYSYEGEAVLTAGDGVGTGKVFHYITGRFDVHQRVYRISDFSGQLDGRYFFYQFSTRFYDRIMAMTAKSSVDSVRMEMIAGMQIPLPPRPEQRAIAAALSDVDALLEALDRLIAKKRDLKQAAMQQLLTGQARLPGFEEEWDVKSLGEVLEVCHGRSQRDVVVTGGKYPILATGGEIGRTDTPLHEGSSVLIGRKGTIDRPRYAEGPFWTVDTLFYTEILGDNSAKYLFYRFCMIEWKNYNEASGVPSLNARTIESIELKLPSPDEQKSIAAVLSDMDAEIEALEQRRTKTAALKQAMMQELLTGRTRLIETAGRNLAENEARPSGRKANVYFMRSVLAAEIVDQLHAELTFGHVKFEKMLFLVEHLCDVDTGSTYHRQAAGPYDNRALRSIDSQLQKQQWFDAREGKGRYRYVPLQKRGGHKRYFDRYFSGVAATFNEIVETFRGLDTERCEIVATLFSAWSDLLREQSNVSDEMIVHEVLNNWHESKQRISKARWLNALAWMREKGFVPNEAASS